MILYVDALDATFFPCHRDLLAEFHTFQADIVFQADDFDWRALRIALAAPRRLVASPLPMLTTACTCARCTQLQHAVWAPEPEQTIASPDVCTCVARPNVEDDIKNDLFPDPPSGAHPKFRCDTLGTAICMCVARLAC